jgi:hypothetical protein
MPELDSLCELIKLFQPNCMWKCNNNEQSKNCMHLVCYYVLYGTGLVTLHVLFYYKLILKSHVILYVF